MPIWQFVDTGDQEQNGSCRVFLRKRDGGVHILECRNQEYDARLTQLRAMNPTCFLVYRIQLPPTSVRLRNSTGVDGSALTAERVCRMSRAEFRRLARRTGYVGHE